MRLRSGAQRLIHLVVIVAGWLLFGWGWYLVAGRPWDTASLVILVVGSLVVLPTLTLLWIAHNLGIHRRKGPRQTVRQADAAYLHDWNGREVQADWPALAGRRTIVISIEDGRKVYRAAGPRAIVPDRRTASGQDQPCLRDIA